MLELYHTQTSILHIHKAVQCEVFEPCQRSVYLKFKQLGYPTDPVGRTKRFDTQRISYALAEDDLSSNTWMNLHTPRGSSQLAGSAIPSPFSSSTSEESTSWGHGCDIRIPRSELVLLSTNTLDVSRQTDSQFMSENGYSQSTAGAATSNSALVPDFAFPSWVFNGGGFEAPQGFANHAYRYHQQGMELQGTSYFGIDIESDYLHPLTTLTSLSDFESTSPGSELARNHTVHFWPLSATPSLINLYTGSVPVQLSAASLPSSSHVINLPFQKVISGSSNTGVRSKIRSLYRPKSDTSFRGRKRYAISKLTDSTADSGYAGCHTSTLSL
ncbi:uncharacterized protein RAG0_10129 [Rhynchosporium agropyri]|uniref:Uncharacterized protein n=1 Tax=Rhynchosporium agropyri TaxID=914238 RepID=A0A1E1KYL0_9HELO|nr:uncharacterized protein RAG0_10129 [Rhynchosporium agropyri]